MGAPGHSLRSWGLLLALLPLRAFAGVSGLVELGYSAVDSRTVDQADRVLDSRAASMSQRYLLHLDQRLFPKLTVAANGALEQGLAWNDLSATSVGPARLWNLDASLTLSDPILSGGAAYAIRSTGATQRLISEAPSLYLNWNPVELPQSTLRLASNRQHDATRTEIDRTTNEAALNVTWSPVKAVDLQYGALYTNPVDHLRGTESQGFTQSARVGFTRRLFDERTTVATSLNASYRLTEISRVGMGGATELLRAPIQGGSAIEDLPFTATDIALPNNAALIDGVTTASAGVNLGFSVAVAGDVRPRHLGAEFTDPLTRVNRIYVYVDRELPPGVAGTFGWEAYRSDDNRLWVPAAIAGPVVFSELFDRFEIPIELVEARFVKVVTRPLDPAVTTDSRFSDVLVTELQAVHLEPVTAVRDWHSTADVTAMGSARTRITDELSHDINLLAGSTGGTGFPARNSYSVANGLTYARPLGRMFHLSSRVARNDGDFGRGHAGAFVYNASLTANPLPTWSHSLVFGGQVGNDAFGWTSANSLSLLTRLAPYRGVGLLSNTTYSIAQTPAGRRVHSELLMLSATVQPHARLTLAGTAAHTGSTTFLGGGAIARDRVNRLEGSFSYSPFSSLYLSGGLSWTVGLAPVTLGNGSIAFSPFPGGALQLSLNYTQTLESSGAIGTFFSPTVRWTIRPGMILSAAYTLYRTGSTIQDTSSQTFGANLQLVL